MTFLKEIWLHSNSFSGLKGLKVLNLRDNSFRSRQQQSTGTIPTELTTLPPLKESDLANKNLSGKIPVYKSNLDLKTAGNPNIGKKIANSSDPNSPSSSNSPNSNGVLLNGKKRQKGVLGGIMVILLIAFAALRLYKKKQKKFSRVQSPYAIVIHPRNSGSDNESIKITVVGSSVIMGGLSETHTIPTNEGHDIQMVESGNVVKEVLGNGELHDGTKIAVKRMEGGGAIKTFRPNL
ncbi:hypothetical protein LXL04_021614 [Taraxacum kok-saghyz]